MINTTVLHMLGLALAALAGIHILPLIAAGVGSDWPLAGLLFASLVFTVFLAGGFMVAARGRLERPNRMQLIILVVAVWALVPAIGALPLYGSGILSDPIHAYFEAVSGLTTTGASVVRDLDALPLAMIIWRASLQWLGGFFTLLTVLLVLVPLGVSGTPVNVHIPGYESGDIVKSTKIVGASILPVYGAMTAACFFALWAAGIPGIDAFCIALSTVSTGGFMPRNGSFELYQAPWAEIVLCVFMILGASSFLAHRAHLRRHQVGHHKDNPESWRMPIWCVVVALVLALVFVTGGTQPADGTSVSALWTGLFRAISLITTTGFNIGTQDWGPVPFVVAIAACFVGGAAFSTAGGIKLFRAMLMIRQARREMVRLVHPHGITQAKSTGRTIDIQLMKSVWNLFFVYLLAAAVLALTLSLEGLGFETSLMAAVAALSNVGPALAMSISPATGVVDYALMSPLALVVLSLGMVAGRVELLVLFSLANVAYWRS